MKSHLQIHKLMFYFQEKNTEHLNFLSFTVKKLRLPGRSVTLEST